MRPVGIHLLAVTRLARDKREVADRRACEEREVIVVLRVETSGTSSTGVSGRIESPDGEASFHGWLDLLGKLEAVVDHARERVRGA